MWLLAGNLVMANYFLGVYCLRQGSTVLASIHPFAC